MVAMVACAGSKGCVTLDAALTFTSAACCRVNAPDSAQMRAMSHVGQHGA
jgi:hypothetical protein